MSWSFLFFVFPPPLCCYCRENFRSAVFQLEGKGNKFFCCLTISNPWDPSLKQLKWGLRSGLFLIYQLSQPGKACKFIHADHRLFHLTKLTYFFKPKLPQEALPVLSVSTDLRPKNVSCFLPKVLLHFSTTEAGLWFQHTHSTFNLCTSAQKQSLHVTTPFLLQSKPWFVKVPTLQADYPEAGCWRFVVTYVCYIIVKVVTFTAP